MPLQAAYVGEYRWHVFILGTSKNVPSKFENYRITILFFKFVALPIKVINESFPKSYEVTH